MATENNQKKSYEQPSIEVIMFDPHEDIVCSSGLTEGGPTDIPGDNWGRSGEDLGLGL